MFHSARWDHSAAIDGARVGIIGTGSTAVQIVGIRSGKVCLGIEAPDEVRVLRSEVPDRVAEWGPEPEGSEGPPTLIRLNQLLKKRLSGLEL